ncbi:hypothetical protein Baya_1612 [Bagarius yarrelli]|uniref:Uncharacterized protein n=1 Tax=Bagarius yarrelli TaxID=175774 RepID=A0A556TLM3_BAGYA|nr:hypothetical protein Baya_1612 [Bagarius yarrelli]
MEFETKVYPHIGGYGRYNRLVAVFSWFPHFAVALNLFCDVFFTLVPESYHCRSDPELLPASLPLSNVSSQTAPNSTAPWLNGSELNHCELSGYPGNSTHASQPESRELVPCPAGWIFGQAAGLHSNFVTETLLISVSFSGLLGVAVCFSNSAEVFQLLRLGQGTALAGVFLSSYIARECHMSVYDVCKPIKPILW